MEFFIPGGDSRVIVLSDKHIHRQIQMHIQTPTIIIFCSVSRCSRTRSDSYHHGCLLCCVKGELLLYCPVVPDCRISFMIFRSSVPRHSIHLLFGLSHPLLHPAHNFSDQLSFISFYYVSIPPQFPHPLCNVYHPTSSDLFIP